MGKDKPCGKMLYKSPSTGDFISQSQYIAELMVKKQADRKGHTLVYKYWNNKDDFWAGEYKNQVAEAAKLLKKYSVQAIINATNVVKWAYSLRTRDLVAEIKNQQKKLDEQLKNIKKEETIVNGDISSFKGNFSRKNILGKKL